MSDAPCLMSQLLQNILCFKACVVWLLCVLGLVTNGCESKEKEEINTLIEQLGDESAEVRWLAAERLEGFGERAKDAVPALMASLNDESEYVSLEALGALGQIDNSKLDMVLPLLIEALRSEREGIRGNAANALGDIGVHAKEAVPALTAALSDEKEGVRNNAANALRKIGTSEALKAIREYQEE